MLSFKSLFYSALLLGGAIGHNLGSGNSSSKKRRRAIIGGAIGSAAAKTTEEVELATAKARILCN